MRCSRQFLKPKVACLLKTPPPAVCGRHHIHANQRTTGAATGVTTPRNNTDPFAIHEARGMFKNPVQQGRNEGRGETYSSRTLIL